ncbi:hypothetical protein L21SP4_01987 [Kiritimatiella glycovorans]|uniref:DUF985 domain-containing protein n=1 Tax=Kiritimatiella glycovorans TaxID=1307763 RepID=A0A0G3EFI1_9BACT|nr:hypothetical protein L21SP4_01987 [Kiritimatiella glycovorans]
MINGLYSSKINILYTKNQYKFYFRIVKHNLPISRFIYTSKSATVNQQASNIIEQYKMEKHPEGGYFKEIYRSNHSIDHSCLEDINDERQLATSIYFLLHDGQISSFHRLTSDEIWYFHAGDPVRVHLFDKFGVYKQKLLNSPLNSHGDPQVIIPAQSIFGAELIKPDGFCLMGCMVAPGFHFDDFELIERQMLLKKYPDQKDIIEKLTLQ